MTFASSKYVANTKSSIRLIAFTLCLLDAQRSQCPRLCPRESQGPRQARMAEHL